MLDDLVFDSGAEKPAIETPRRVDVFDVPSRVLVGRHRSYRQVEREDSGVWRRIQCQLQRGIAVECADFDNGARPQLLRQRADKSELLDADIAIGRMKVLEGNRRFFAKEIKRGNRCDGAAADHYLIIDAEELLLDFARISSKTADDRGDLPQFVPRRNQSFRPSSVLRR